MWHLLSAGAGTPPLPVSMPALKVDSELFDARGNLSISNMLDARDRHQSGKDAFREGFGT